MLQLLKATSKASSGRAPSWPLSPQQPPPGLATRFRAHSAGKGGCQRPLPSAQSPCTLKMLLSSCGTQPFCFTTHSKLALLVHSIHSYRSYYCVPSPCLATEVQCWPLLGLLPLSYRLSGGSSPHSHSTHPCVLRRYLEPPIPQPLLVAYLEVGLFCSPAPPSALAASCILHPAAPDLLCVTTFIDLQVSGFRFWEFFSFLFPRDRQGKEAETCLHHQSQKCYFFIVVQNNLYATSLQPRFASPKPGYFLSSSSS